MHTYSQNSEDLFILNYFGNYKGTVLEIGANDGRTLSNSLAFIEAGWHAALIEPGREPFNKLYELHEINPRIKMYNYGIGERFEMVKFYESGTHVIGGNDNGLVSTADYNETERWRNQGVQFKETEIQLNTFADFYNFCPYSNFDYISIDAEGYDLKILQQINLTEVGCKALCIEHNGMIDLANVMTEYCMCHGLKLAHQNNENLIFLK